MNCNLTEKERKDGMRCRSWDCKPCFEFNTSLKDQNLIRSHMVDMNKSEIDSLRQQITKLQEGLDHYVSESSTWHTAAKKHYEELKKLQEEIKELRYCKELSKSLTRDVDRLNDENHYLQEDKAKLVECVKELDSFILHVISEMRRAWDKRANCIGCCGGADIPEEELCRACWHVTYDKKGYALWDTESTFLKLPSTYKELIQTLKDIGEV